MRALRRPRVISRVSRQLRRSYCSAEPHPETTASPESQSPCLHSHLFPMIRASRYGFSVASEACSRLFRYEWCKPRSSIAAAAATALSNNLAIPYSVEAALRASARTASDAPRSPAHWMPTAVSIDPDRVIPSNASPRVGRSRSLHHHPPPPVAPPPRRKRPESAQLTPTSPSRFESPFAISPQTSTSFLSNIVDPLPPPVSLLDQIRRPQGA